MSVDVTMGVKNLPISRCFLLVVTWFLNFSKFRMWILNYTQEDTFVPYFMQIGRVIASTNSLVKKDKKDKSTAFYNITPDFEKFHFYKNGNIIKLWMVLLMYCSANACVFRTGAGG